MMQRSLFGDCARATQADALQFEKTKLLYAGMPAAIAINALLAVILASVQSAVVNPTRSLGWLAMIVTILLVRAALRLQQALATAKRDHAQLALMFIDLDKFKPVNDTHGHHVGDHLLKEVARRIQDCLRESDTVGRIGGDEFVVLLPVVKSVQDAMEVAEKIHFSLNQPFELAGNSLRISSSTGVAIYPEHGDEEKQLIKNADDAMYYAKSMGRDNVKIYRSDKVETIGR